MNNHNIFIIYILLLGLGVVMAKEDLASERLKTFYAKEKVTILITDSGLGGLSVAAKLEANFREHHPFREVKLIFVNALANETLFYNRMENTEEKVRVFNNALTGMTKKFAPDLILIACNTLSVIFDQTEFSKTSNVPVVGIVEFGVDLMLDNLRQSEANGTIILGTPTTIEQNTHKAALLAAGIKPETVQAQACPMLESEIQNAPGSDMVRMMIEMFAEESLDKFEERPSENLYVGLCCTHYNYAAPVFAEVFAQVSGTPVTILDPNELMSDFIFKDSNSSRFEKTEISVQVVSQAKLTENDIESIAGMIQPVSKDFSEGLKKYQWMSDLFQY